MHAVGNGEGVQAGQQRERDGEELDQYGRNVRQNVGPLPPDCSRNNVDLTTANLVPKQGTISHGRAGHTTSDIFERPKSIL